MKEVIQIRLDVLVAHAVLATNYNLPGLEALQKHMLANGQDTPVYVLPDLITLVSGRRRLEARRRIRNEKRENGEFDTEWETIPAVVCEPENVEEFIFQCNRVHRQKMFQEYYNEAKWLKTQPGSGHADTRIAKWFNESEHLPGRKPWTDTRVNYLMKIGEYDEKIENEAEKLLPQIDTGELSFNAAYLSCTGREPSKKKKNSEQGRGEAKDKQPSPTPIKEEEPSGYSPEAEAEMKKTSREQDNLDNEDVIDYYMIKCPRCGEWFDATEGREHV